MDRIIKADLYRHDGLKGVSGFLYAFLFIPGFRYLYLFRKASKHRKHSIPCLFYKLLLLRYSYKYGFRIFESTQIGEGFYIGHCGSVYVHGYAKIGKYCNITHNVTIGQANRGRLKGVPTLGDKVWIGTGAVIVGNIKIGSNVLISPNSFVAFDVPDNSVVMGNPGKIMHRENATEGYIENIPEY
jgi:serine O-acetyltransferase